MDWMLEEGIDFLNHGSFGAVPRVVQTEQTRWRDAMEANPVRFMLEQYQPALEIADAMAARFHSGRPYADARCASMCPCRNP